MFNISNLYSYAAMNAAQDLLCPCDLYSTYFFRQANETANIIDLQYYRHMSRTSKLRIPLANVAAQISPGKVPFRNEEEMKRSSKTVKTSLFVQVNISVTIDQAIIHMICMPCS